MSRTGRRKLIYGLMVLLGSGVGVWVATRPYIHFNAKLAIGFLLLIPGRIHGYLFRGIYTSLRAANSGNYEACVEAARQLITDLQRNPWKERLSFWGIGIYSSSIQSVAYNNIGGAHIYLAQQGEAENALKKSIELDPLNPLPYFNLAVLERLRGSPQKADELAARSWQLGYTGGTTDAVMQKVAEIYAYLEGRKASAYLGGAT